MLTNVVIARSASRRKTLFQMHNGHKAHVDKHKSANDYMEGSGSAKLK